MKQIFSGLASMAGKALVIAAVVLIGLAVTLSAQQGAWVRVNGLAEQVQPPQILSVSNTVRLAFTNNESATDGRPITRLLQNLGTNPLYYLLRGTNIPAATASNISITNFHGILAQDTALRAGAGGRIDLSFWRGEVYVAVPTNSAGASNATIFSAVELTQ